MYALLLDHLCGDICVGVVPRERAYFSTCVLNSHSMLVRNTLHRKVDLSWHIIARLKRFTHRTLTGISIFCLADRKSPWVTRIFGGANNNEGLGAFALCFDWAYVGSGGGAIGAMFTLCRLRRLHVRLQCGDLLVCFLINWTTILGSPSVLATR